MTLTKEYTKDQGLNFDIYNELIARVHVAANNEDASDVLNVKQHGTNPGAKNAK